MTESDLGWERLLFSQGDDVRWTQDSPVLPNVWRRYFEAPGEPVDLLITPHRRTRPADLATRIRDLLGQPQGAQSPEVAHNQSTVVVKATFEQLVTQLVPLSKWFKEKIGSEEGSREIAKLRRIAGYGESSKQKKELLDALRDPGEEFGGLSNLTVWWLRLIGHLAPRQEDDGKDRSESLTVLDRALELIHQAAGTAWAPSTGESEPLLFRISVNREAEAACIESVSTVKADAVWNVFKTDTSRLCWAVVDSGIDSRHPAFHDARGRSRVKAAYDFTRIRRLILLASAPGDLAAKDLEEEFDIDLEKAQRIRSALVLRGDVDWEALRPALQVAPDDDERDEYTAKLSFHGTHVAGLVGGRRVEVPGEDDFSGMCQEIQMIDIRVLDSREKAGEFDILAALQFIRHLNSAGDDPVVHGVNLSLQLQHQPKDYACGRTPICEECERLVDSGVVVVAAAGNLGITGDAEGAATTEGSFRDTSIADPGNAESVITVGATHRKRPHAYGVSYFSSRGPTGDGRSKPDLVAPGEKILGPVPDGGYRRTEGTSMAAPHVSGAAALLMARHSELIGEPRRIKQILCSTATDLGRERAFQGAGLLDVLRALQSM